jgi:hypothetical protein
MVVNPRAQEEKAELYAQPFLLFLIDFGDSYAPKGLRTHAMSPPWQGLNPLDSIATQATKTASAPAKEMVADLPDDT